MRSRGLIREVGRAFIADSVLARMRPNYARGDCHLKRVGKGVGAKCFVKIKLRPKGKGKGGEAQLPCKLRPD